MRIEARHTRRLRTVSLLGVAFSLVLAFRLVSMQLWAGNVYSDLARRQHEKRTVLQADRGRVLDRHGRVFATNLEAQSFFLNNIAELDSLRAIAVRFTRRTGRGSLSILDRLEHRRSFVWLARKVVDGLLEEKVPEGVGRIVELRRSYPMGPLSGQVLGYTDIDNVGIEGVELRFDDLLRGTPGEMTSLVDAGGKTLGALGEIHRMPEDGADLVLTIDADYQAIAEEELATAVAEFKARSGIVIVTNPSSGEILAMANVPLYDPNAFVRYDAEVRRNRAVTDLCEPGSTFKAFTFAAALAEKLVQPEDLVFCEDGLMPISGGFVRDVHPSGWLTVRGVLEESSNIGTIKVARKLGPARLYRYIRMFGFGNETGATVSGEVAGDVKHPSDWSSRSLESICIGQEVGVTALQMAAAYGAVANGGRLMVPRILLKAVREDSVLQVESPETVRQVVSREVAGTVVSFLEGVVAHGTGSNAQVKGYRTAGKTGTAQRVSDGGTGYDPDLYVSSFIGFLPVEQPELLGLVIVDSPQGTHYGSQVAAPVFSRMMQRVLSLRETPLRHRARPAGGEGAGGRAAEAVRSAKDASPAPVERGSRDEAAEPDLDVVKTSLATDSDGSARIGTPLEMPDVVGIPLRQAVSRLTSSGLQVRMRGSGMVVDQRPRPGTVVARGSVCRVICRTAG